ncbi:metallophosphoesterase [Gelidibacter salicanalis]|uniref:Metallophosphoesterase n=1 Tax=Gelidibacter salicanalis TaxID=291193 RepID=A0A5C7AJE1_9FLAO|nr:metallophosphoesterase [Gelidibacter salicanalis]TXE08708.1 metallophosphoesterase [Gelidibacter salicanalis]
MLRWVLFTIVYILIALYGFQAIRTLTKSVWIHYVFIGIAVIIAGNLILQFSMGAGGRVLSPSKSYAFGFILSFMLFNMVLIIFLLGEDIIRVASGAYAKLFGTNESFHMPSRRKFISGIALSVAAVPFASMLYGMYKGKYNYKVIKHTLHFDDLPAAFDGYRITHISDIHSGSFDNRLEIEHAVNLVKAQGSDAIMFTGDLVNNKSSEMSPWKELFAELKANDGVYSVLGNHDYGDYIDWDSTADKKQNLDELIQLQKEMGYDLLLNEHRFIERDGQRLALIGCENWGRGGFKKAGDLKKASEGIHKDDFKILMTHDPSHWNDVVLEDDYHYHLTLSGHTHGMQFGIEIPGWVKWSPIKYRYKHWAGVYKEMGQYINVNRGFGFLGFPGRVGIWPEITVIELKKGTETMPA